VVSKKESQTPSSLRKQFKLSWRDRGQKKKGNESVLSGSAGSDETGMDFKPSAKHNAGKTCKFHKGSQKKGIMKDNDEPQRRG